MTNQSIQENTECSRLVRIVEDSDTLHKHMKGIIFLDKLRSDLPPKQDGRCLPVLEFFDRGVLPNNFLTSPNMIADGKIISNHVNIQVLAKKLSLGDRIPKLVKEFNMLLSISKN
jgi:hypothetical protein